MVKFAFQPSISVTKPNTLTSCMKRTSICEQNCLYLPIFGIQELALSNPCIGLLRSMSSSSFTQSTVTDVNVDETYLKGTLRESPNLRVFTFAELKMATRNFRPDAVLGEGGSGRVYKGRLDETMNPTKPGVGMVVAIKKLNRAEIMQPTEQMEWQTVVHFLGRLSHPNLLKLLGYCVEDDCACLVSEFMTKGSLENRLFRRGADPLPWSLRVKILVGAARGLAFLHSLERPVIHGNFKTSNILLDSDYNAKLSDLSLAKYGPDGGLSHMTTRVMDTNGYAAPEYAVTGHLSVKSDVYSFGVVLLEMLSGRRVVDKNRPIMQQNLVDWARPYLGDPRKLSWLMDTHLGGQYSSKGARQIARLARGCLSHDRNSRPSMNEVVDALRTIDPMNSKAGAQAQPLASARLGAVTEE